MSIIRIFSPIKRLGRFFLKSCVDSFALMHKIYGVKVFLKMIRRKRAALIRAVIVLNIPVSVAVKIS